MASQNDIALLEPKSRTDDDSSGNKIDDEDDADAILAELEADDDVSTLVQQRIQEQQQQKGSAVLNAAGGTGAFNGRSVTGNNLEAPYQTLTSDDATLQFTTEHARAVVHFFHPGFARCEVMDGHLDLIARKHAVDLRSYHGDGGESGESEVKFARVDVQNAPFVVERMGIRVLPCVVGFAKGVAQGRVLGFDGLLAFGGGEGGASEKDVRVCMAVEERLVDWGILKRKLVGVGNDEGDEDYDSEEAAALERERRRGKSERLNGRRGIRGRKHKVGDDGDDDDDDWD